MMDVLLIALNMLICLGGAWVCIQVRSNHLPALATAASGISTMLVWMLLVRYTRMSLVVASAWYDVATALGYFVGFACFGEQLSPMQWLGVVLLMIGLFIIN
jgi:drug/metabolite transporter (DMT)-like permease